MQNCRHPEQYVFVFWSTVENLVNRDYQTFWNRADFFHILQSIHQYDTSLADRVYQRFHLSLEHYENSAETFRSFGLVVRRSIVVRLLRRRREETLQRCTSKEHESRFSYIHGLHSFGVYEYLGRIRRNVRGIFRTQRDGNRFGYRHVNVNWSSLRNYRHHHCLKIVLASKSSRHISDRRDEEHFDIRSWHDRRILHGSRQCFLARSNEQRLLLRSC